MTGLKNPFGKTNIHIISLTGGIASGKSSASGEFKRLGAAVIDCDAIARRMCARGGGALTRIARSFGAEVINKDGSLNRKKLGSAVFSDQLKRKKLEAILHPCIMEEVRGQLLALKNESFVIIDVPLLFETGLNRFADKVIVVWLPEKVQRERLRKRDGLSAREISLRLSSQMPLEEKRRKADYVIDNSGTRGEFKKCVKNILEVLTKQFK